MAIHAGDWIDTPRFCTVKIQHVYSDREAAIADGYTEPTHYVNPNYEVLGKHTGTNMMQFAAAVR